MRELKCSRKFENNSDVNYYDGYTKFTVPRVRGNQYNPMIVGEREELFKNILDSIDKKQTSPIYDDLFYVEGKYIDAGGGVEDRNVFSHSEDDYTKVNILCELLDKKTGKTLKSFEKDLVIDYSDFMDSYGIESDIEDYILDELQKYLTSMLAQYDNKYKNEHRTKRELKRSRKLEANENILSDNSISSEDLFYILASLAGLSNSNSILKNEAAILENIATKYKGENVRLDLPILANNFNGDLSDLLFEIFDHVEGIKQQAEQAIKYHAFIKNKYGL